MANTSGRDFNPFSGPELLAVVALTEEQREIWASILMDKTASLCYNESFSVHLKGKLDTLLMIESIGKLVNRHEALRSTISPDGSFMYIYHELTSPVPVLDAPEVGSDKWDEIVFEKTCEIYDLVNGPLFKAYIFCHSPEEFTLILMAHHIICDGWSLDILLEDLSRIYTTGILSNDQTLPASNQFSEYVEYLDTLEIEKKNSENYWKQIYSRKIEPLALPIDYTRPGVRTYRAERIIKNIDGKILSGIKNLVSITQSSLFTVLLTAWAVHISRLTNQNEIVIGVPFAGQPYAGMNDLVGHCASLLPILVKVDGDISITDQIKETKSAVLDAYENQHLSFGSLIQKINIDRDPSRIPLISISFTHTQKFSGDKILFGDCSVDYRLNPRSAETFEIHLNAVESSDGVDLICHYNTALFSGKTVRRFLDGLEELFRSAILAPEKPSNGLNIVPNEELEILNSWNSTEPDETAGWNYIEQLEKYLIHNLFESQSLKNPDAVAACCGEETISYRELDERANQVADYLKSLDIKDGDVVGVSVERSLNMLVSVLGVLKAGGCYLPMDPVFPDERIRFMYHDSAAKVLITQSSLAQKYKDFETKTVFIDKEWPLILNQSTEKIPDTINNQNLAYIIYTSGTTGRPKGVKVHHQAVVNFLLSMLKVPGITESDRLLAVTTLSFDISVLELFLPVISGATVVIARESEIMDAVSISSLIENFDITMLQATPATWSILIGSGWKGRSKLKVLCGGEAISLNLVKELLPRAGSVWNMYGPTETTVWSACYRFDTDNPRILVGKPIDNTQIFILDSRNNIQPIGVTGEVCIGGLGVTKGYHNREDLTSEKFVNGPGDKPVYKTGDLGRFLDDGNIEIFGRSDDQIKLRGFRIEPGEIETALCEVGGINEAVVKVHKSGESDDKLVAYLKIDDGLDINNTEIVKSISINLPMYMIPSVFVRCKEFPRTPNGKIDRKALKFDSAEIFSGREVKKPENEMQTAVFDIWAEVLKIDSFGIDDNFFELGGHSLLVAEVQSRLKKEMNCEIAIVDLFTHPTIKSITELISGTGDVPEKLNSLQERAKRRRLALAARRTEEN